MKIPNPFNKLTSQTNLTSGDDGTVVSKTPQPDSGTSNTPKLEQQIETLVPGQTLQGEVVSKNGKDITLKLPGDLVLTARLEKELNLELGRLLTFQVKNNGKVLSLSPLFANMSMDKTVHKALEMANIPITNRNVEMASSMMQHGMAVDINSIQNVYKDVVNFGMASVEHIVKLHQMDIPVTADNLYQLISYENMEHQLVDGMNQIVNDLKAEGLDQQLLNQMVQGMDNNDSILVSQVLTEIELEILVNNIRQLSTSIELPTQLTDFLENPSQVPLSMKELFRFIAEVPMDINLSKANEMLIDTAQTTNVEQLGSEFKIDNSLILTNVGNDFQNASAVSTFEQIDSSVLLSTSSAFLKEFWEGEVFGKLLHSFLLNKWSLKPDEFSNKQMVRDFYNRIYTELEGLKNSLKNIKGEDAPSLKSVNTLQSNINFLNHLNQMYNYIQIPLSMNGKSTHGELYVYTNKKNLARTDGTISALLHLDMEHLGPVDVYVAMQNQNVTTNFYLATDELLDFIHEHIYILDEHLAKRGYTLNCKLIQREDVSTGINVMQEIAKEDPEKMVLSQYAFDVRA